MAKEKLFSPEDFDKPHGDKSKWYSKIFWIIGVLVVLAALAWAITTKIGESKENEEIQSNRQTEVPPAVNSQDTSMAESDEIVNLQPSKLGTKETQTNAASKLADVEPQVASEDVETEAMKVIRGDYGNVPERKERLGSRYQAIQNRVNELKRKGVF